jgi:hypothetical protein
LPRRRIDARADDGETVPDALAGVRRIADHVTPHVLDAGAYVTIIVMDEGGGSCRARSARTAPERTSR